MELLMWATRHLNNLPAAEPKQTSEDNNQASKSRQSGAQGRAGQARGKCRVMQQRVKGKQTQPVRGLGEPKSSG